MADARILGLSDLSQHGWAMIATINFPGALDTYTFGFNTRDVVGCYVDASGAHGNLNPAGPLIGSMQYPLSTPRQAINDRGEIVGESTAGVERGFVCQGGAFQTLSAPRASGVEPGGVNNAGQIVGLFYDSAAG